MILTLLGKGVGNVIIAIVVVEWAIYARTMRSSASVESHKDYVEAAQNLAIGSRRIAFGHVLPNCLPPITVVAALQCARAITLEATLSFLGIGVPITRPSLGLLVSNGYSYLLSGQYWMSFYPGLMLLVLIVSINIVGDRLREILNPRLHR
jgi:peptide/nickel transport system permease protein